MDQSNPTTPERPKYASLTASLLARKGEAVPVASSVSPNAMSHHLPARRLAQESQANESFSERPDREVESMRDVDLNLGPLHARAALIEDALSNDKAAAGTKRGSDHKPSGQSKKASLGLSGLVDRAIASAEVQKENPVPRLDGSQSTDDTSCSHVRKEFVASIRDTAVVEGVAMSSLQLDPRRFIRLQVAAMKLEVSKQELMAAALDSFLDTLLEDVFSECTCMQKGLI
jgi:hypothetical protein